MKNTIARTFVIVLLLAVAGSLAVCLAFGDEIAKSVAGDSQETPPPTAPVARGSVQRAVTGVSEVRPFVVEKLKPADSWHWLSSFDATLNKRIAAGEKLVTFANGETWTAPYDLVVSGYVLPEKNKGAVTKDDHFIEVQRIDKVNAVLSVSETDLAAIAKGQSVKVKLGGDGTRVYDGVVAGINEVGAYAATGSKFAVTVEVLNDGNIKLGMSANLSIMVAEATDVLTVPVSAVSGAGEDKHVETYDSETGELRTVPVVVGITDGKIVEVTGEGLHEGDVVLLDEADALDNADSRGATFTPALSAA